MNTAKGFASYVLTFPDGGPRLELTATAGGLSAAGPHPSAGYTHLAVGVGSEAPVVDVPRRADHGHREAFVLDPVGVTD